MEQLAEKQPKKGDVVLHCDHPQVKGQHFFFVPEMPFQRPDGTRGKAQWITLCDHCFVKSGGDPHKADIRGDGEWDTDSKPIKKAVLA